MKLTTITSFRSFPCYFFSPHKIWDPVSQGYVDLARLCVASSTNQAELALKLGRGVHPGPAARKAPSGLPHRPGVSGSLVRAVFLV